MQQIEICICRIPYIVSYAHTHILTYIHLPAHLISLPADVHNVSRRIFCSPTILPCSSPPPSRPSMADSSASYRVDARYSPWVGMYVCEPGCVEAYMYVCRRKKSQHFFTLSSSYSSPDRPRRCFQIYHRMDLCAGDALRVSFCRLDLTLLLFRAKRRMKFADFIAEAAFTAVSHTYTTGIHDS